MDLSDNKKPAEVSQDKETANQTLYFRKNIRTNELTKTYLSDYPRTVETPSGPSYEELFYTPDRKPCVLITTTLRGTSVKDEKVDRLLTQEDLDQESKEYVERYLPELKQNFDNPLYTPMFKPNPKYENKRGYIAFDDVMNYRYQVREYPLGEEYSPSFIGNLDDPIIATYKDAEELLLDGWKFG